MTNFSLYSLSLQSQWTVSHLYTQITPDIVHGTWSIKGDTFYGVMRDGSISKTEYNQGNAQWTTVMGWSSTTKAGSNEPIYIIGTRPDDFEKVYRLYYHKCVAVPTRYGNQLFPSPVLICYTNIENQYCLDSTVDNDNSCFNIITVDTHGDRKVYESVFPSGYIQRVNEMFYHEGSHSLFIQGLVDYGILDHGFVPGCGWGGLCFHYITVVQIPLSVAYDPIWTDAQLRVNNDYSYQKILSGATQHPGYNDRMYFYRRISDDYFELFSISGLNDNSWGTEQSLFSSSSGTYISKIPWTVSRDYLAHCDTPLLTITDKQAFFVYEPHMSRLITTKACKPCSTCDDGTEYIGTECTSFADRVCATCSKCTPDFGLDVPDYQYISSGCNFDNTNDDTQTCNDCNVYCYPDDYMTTTGMCDGTSKTNSPGPQIVPKPTSGADYTTYSMYCQPCAVCEDTFRNLGWCQYGKNHSQDPGCKSCKTMQGGGMRMCPIGKYVASTTEDPVCRGNSKTQLNISTHCALCTPCNAGYVPDTAGAYCDGNTFVDAHIGNANCKICTSCGEGNYRTGGCTAEVSGVSCGVCTSCEPGNKLTAPCSGIYDYQDKECTWCGNCPNANQWISAPCDASDASVGNVNVCSDCSSSCSVGQYISEPCDGTTLTDVAAASCLNCDPCSPGKYIFAQCPGNTTTPDSHDCRPCDSCADGQYISGGCDGTGTSSGPVSCEYCTNCSVGEYVVTRCNGSAVIPNQMCAACAPCAEGEYIAVPCPGGSVDPYDRVCMPCNNCSTGQYIIGCDGTGNSPSDRTCVPCASCPVNQYVSSQCPGNGTKDTERSCSVCGSCGSDEYFESRCSGSTVTDVHSCSACTNDCGPGKYIDSPCTQFSDTVCKTCFECPQGYFEGMPCSGKGSTPQQSCTPCYCPAGQRLNPYGNPCTGGDNTPQCIDIEIEVDETPPAPAPTPAPPLPAPLPTPAATPRVVQLQAPPEPPPAISTGAAVGIASGVVLLFGGLALAYVSWKPAESVPLANAPDVPVLNERGLLPVATHSGPNAPQVNAKSQNEQGLFQGVTLLARKV